MSELNCLEIPKKKEGISVIKAGLLLEMFEMVVKLLFSNPYPLKEVTW
jgi:hypothetical protein